MTETQLRMISKEFYRCLGVLRAKIDALPEQHRAALRAGADKAQELHERARHTCTRIDDMVADLNLVVKHAKFDAAACRRELHEPAPRGRFRV